jgi:amino acid adenylation domain-containing protein
MSVISLLSRLKESGVRVRLIDDNLKIHAPKGKLTPGLLAELKQRKGQIIEYLRDVLKDDVYSPIEPVEKKEYYELSSAQKRLYLIHQIIPDTTAYNMPMPMLASSPVDSGLDRIKTKVESVLKQLISRHESFRTSFEVVDGRPVQRIHDKVDFAIEYDELATGDNSFIRPFDLSKAPLLRVLMVDTKNSKHRLLLIDMHHIISDGTSQEILEREFIALYKGKEPDPLKVQYKDYSQWQNSSQQKKWIKKMAPYWLKEFPVHAPLPVINLPTDYPRPSIQSFEGNQVYSGIPRDHTSALKTIALEEKATPYMVLLAVYNIFLSKLSGQEDIIIGTPTAGRSHADLEPVIGMFVNTLALRNYPNGEKTFADFLAEIKGRTLAAFENQDYPFENLVEKISVGRDTSRNPLFDVMFVMQTQMGEKKIPANSITGNTDAFNLPKNLNPTAKFDLTLSITENEGKLQINFSYSTQLFNQETIRRFMNYFFNISSRICENPRQQISNIQFIDEKEKRQILADFNATETPYPHDKTIHHLFEEQAARTPERIAVVGSRQLAVGKKEKMHLIYRVLNEKANHLAGVFKEKGVLAGVRRTQPINSIVGIMVERSLEMIIGILGILKAGGAYLPIDPEYPQERIDYLLKDSGAKILLINLPEGHQFNCQLSIVNCQLSMNASEADLHHSSFITHHLDLLAYILYTSGTTGRPKGVMVEHRNVVRLVKKTNFTALGQDTRLLQTAPLEFDASTFEIWGPLLNGGVLHVTSREDILNPKIIKEKIQGYGINTVWMTAPLFKQMADTDLDIFNGLRNLLVGGDVLSPSHIYRVKDRFPGLNIINGYGPTENTTFSTTYLIDNRHKENIPIGKPIANSTAYIVNRHNQLLPIGAAGELCVGGDGIARGYLNNPELTAEKFIEYRSYRTYRTYRNYKTGDLACWLPDGNIRFLGRLDQQVKIRGFRVELAEIENCLTALEEIKETVVTARKDEKGEKYLCAYVVPNNEQDINVSFLIRRLAAALPDFMIPSRFIKIDQIPLTPNKKVDLKALPEPETSRPQLESVYLAPVTRIEKLIADTWQNVLNVDRIGINDNFFDLGGNSLRLVEVILKLRTTLRTEIPTMMMFQYPTVHLLAQHIMEEEEKQGEIAAAEKQAQWEKLNKGKERLKATRKKIR